MRAYVLVEASVGTAHTMVDEIRRLNAAGVKLLSTDAVTGPYDVIVLLEGSNLDLLARFVAEKIQAINGVQRTTTCVA